MLNPINEMRRLSSRSYDDLLRIATTNYGFCPGSKGRGVSKVELITYIVTVAAIHDQFAEMIAHPKETATGRSRYRFREMDGTEHYVMLTPEQERFMRWNHDNAIDYDSINIDVIEDIEWETP